MNRATAGVLALSCLGLSSGRRDAGSNLPARLADYRGWRASEVHAVSAPLAALCVALPPKELQRARSKARRAYGPHAERYVRVYANPRAALTRLDTVAKEFPAGSIFAKEKLIDPTGTQVEGIAFMIKHPAGAFSGSGGWEFRYYPENREASYSGCIDCHKAGASRDYVFGSHDGAAQK